MAFVTRRVLSKGDEMTLLGKPWCRLCPAILWLASCMFTAPALANTILLTLDDVSVSACGEVWTEHGVPMWFASTEGEENYPIGCVFDPHAEINGLQGVYLGPGQLVIDVSGLQGLDSIYMDVHNVQGNVRAHMMDGDDQVYYHSLSTPGDLLMFLPALGGDRVLLSVADGYVTEIRLEGESLPTEVTSFGAAKALYSTSITGSRGP
jgi:hypothetical protein